MIVLSLQWMRFQEYQGGVGDRLHLDLTRPIIAIRSNPITICISQHSHYLYFQHNTLQALTDPKSKKIRYHFENRFKDFTNMDQNIIIFVVWQPIWIVGEGLCQLCHQEVLNDELSMCITCLLTAVLREESCKNAITFLMSSGHGKTYYISMHGPRGVYIKWDAQSICTATRWKYCVKIHLLWEEICFLI